jgi:thioredoxin-like negative regulator of GroEL
MLFGKIDSDAQADLAEAFEIRSVPTLMVIREQILVFRQSGVLSEAQLQQVLEQARLIDMDELRAEIAAAEGDLDAIDH